MWREPASYSFIWSLRKVHATWCQPFFTISVRLYFHHKSRKYSIAIFLPAAADPVDKRYMGNFEREQGEMKVGGAYASDEKDEGTEKGGLVVTMSDLKREWGV